MFRFHIRDLLWLTLLAAVVVAWWVDRRAQARRIDDLEKAAAANMTYFGYIELSQATLMIDPVEVKSESPHP